MSFSVTEVFTILEQYKYWVIFPISVLEGPIITVISGFLVYLGHLNVYVAFTILTIGDLVGDALHYEIGKYWQKFKWIKKAGYFLGYDEKSEKYIENHFIEHQYKTLLTAKVLHGIGGTIQIAAGMARMDFARFMYISFLGTIPKTIFLISLGYYVGGSYVEINGYLNIIAFTMIGMLLVALLYFFLNKRVRRYFMVPDGVE